MKIRANLLNLAGFVLGLALLTAGIYLIYPPAALIVPGLILMSMSLFGGQKK